MPNDEILYNATINAFTKTGHELLHETEYTTSRESIEDFADVIFNRWNDGRKVKFTDEYGQFIGIDMADISSLSVKINSKDD